ncbi:cytochrome c oxidase subunit II [Nocardioides sp.]|uniref:aa3-type cytochrome oxidase subunit II n=1 Tax=Nocardioides sp. TaxID=35761 RepID=UPI0035687BAE
MPDPASVQGEEILVLWQGAWIAALLTGVVVWGLIFYAVVRFRRRSDDEIPVQTRYNLPLEIFYTLAPVVMVIVFFSHTVKVQNSVLADEGTPDNIIEVTGQQWQWTFNYGLGEIDPKADDDRYDDVFSYPEYVHVAGTGSFIPTLYLPVNETTRFNLYSPDVIHDFGVPGFLMKMDVLPGRVNHYVVTPTRVGDYVGKCYELCGTYHSRMLFNVKVVTRAEYDSYVAGLEADGQTSEKPLRGSDEAYTQAGLNGGESE